MVTHILTKSNMLNNIIDLFKKYYLVLWRECLFSLLLQPIDWVYNCTKACHAGLKHYILKTYTAISHYNYPKTI